MSCSAVKCLQRAQLWTAAVGIFVTVLSGPTVLSLAADEPQPDPSGIATGDRSNAIDAASNSFAVSEPTDQVDPNSAKQKADLTHTRTR